ncbi:MAG: GNAT family N-acetyltransferase [Clostridia bacterium]|jgi:ribosomal protein S18 acetylase RimI-like enzyme|nr:GNAT family N-acetyltransferase [Clostridia bacterium]
MQIIPYENYNEAEILALYGAVGWVAYTRDPDSLRAGFGNSLLTLAAYEDEKLIGIIRTVGDGATIVYIQDIIVHPEHQGRGVGSALIAEILERFRSVRQIVLLTDDTEKTVSFYRKIGLKPAGDYGCRAFMK